MAGSLLSSMTSLSNSSMYPQMRRGSWCDDISSDSDHKKNSGSERELSSKSEFVYPNTNDVKPYVSGSLRELKDIDGQDL